MSHISHLSKLNAVAPLWYVALLLVVAALLVCNRLFVLVCYAILEDAVRAVQAMFSRRQTPSRDG